MTTQSSLDFPASSRTLNALRIPDLSPSDQDMASSSSSPVPFPRISQRRKLYRGVGTQPWHNRTSSDSDSDSETQTQPHKPSAVSVAAVATPAPAPAPPKPSPEIMPGSDPKRTYSESQIHSLPVTPLLTVYTTPLIIRKKSGDVVKSALKSRSPSISSVGSGSMPPTPTMEKYVHFDGQLEHVKFFKKEHKPSAVSREGSPNESETSDNDTYGPSDVNYRSSEEERLRSNLVLETVNIPLRNAMASTQERLGDLDIRLEQVKLSQDGRNVDGTVLVRNIAFEKWVAVRFTYDWWQTTSEVSAKYASSFPEEGTDLFSFAIRLPDVTRRIEEKRLFFALHYTVGGKECWDNNRGQNYQVRFKMESKIRQNPSPSSKFPPSWPVKTANIDQMADLRRELERVVREDEESSGTQSWDMLTAKLRARNMDIEEDRDAKKLNLKNRYDFDASSKVKWEAPKELPKYGRPPPETAVIPFPTSRQAHTPKAASFSGPLPPPQLTTSGSWRAPRGSPRENGSDSTVNSPKFFIDPRDAKHWGGASPQSQKSPTRTRNHQRGGGYFDAWVEGASKTVITPRTTVEDETSVEMVASSSVDSCATVTQMSADNVVVAQSPTISITEDSTEGSETESTSSSTESSSVNGASAVDATIGLGIEQARAMRFNSYPMDRSYITAATAGSSPGATVSPASAPTLTVPGQPGWNISPQGSLSSVASTPSFTSASSPSQCPSSPSELSDSLRTIAQPGTNRPRVDSLDYGYFLKKFCYFTGNDVEDRHNVTNAYGSAHHRHTVSESNMDSAWQAYERPAFITSPGIDEASWSGESGHTTPTRSPIPLDNSPGKRTPRAGSPIDLDSTPRISEPILRTHRGSL